jgi:hypothetical protein
MPTDDDYEPTDQEVTWCANRFKERGEPIPADLGKKIAKAARWRADREKAEEARLDRFMAAERPKLEADVEEMGPKQTLRMIEHLRAGHLPITAEEEERLATSECAKKGPPWSDMERSLFWDDRWMAQFMITQSYIQIACERWPEYFKDAARKKWPEHFPDSEHA